MAKQERSRRQQSRRVGPDARPPILGWREWVGLPDLAVQAVKAKVDTGARTSALHTHALERFRRRGRDWVRFVIHPLQRRSTPAVPAEAALVDERWVRSSGGERQLRPVVRTTVAWRDLRWLVELTLTNRDVMGFRMLLGREAVRSRFLVDPGASWYGGKPPLRLRRPRKETS